MKAAGFAATDFDAVVSADGFERIKPAPDIFLAAAALVGTEPSSCVVVEDASAGIQAARAAGGLGVCSLCDDIMMLTREHMAAVAMSKALHV